MSSRSLSATAWSAGDRLGLGALATSLAVGGGAPDVSGTGTPEAPGSGAVAAGDGFAAGGSAFAAAGAAGLGSTLAVPVAGPPTSATVGGGKSVKSGSGTRASM